MTTDTEVIAAAIRRQEAAAAKHNAQQLAELDAQIAKLNKRRDALIGMIAVCKERAKGSR